MECEPLEENVAYHTSGIKSTVVTLLILNLGRVMGSNLERLTALENSQVKDFQYQLAVYIYNKGIGAGKFSAATPQLVCSSH